MPTIFSHPATALVKTWAPSVPARAYAAGAILSILPDGDVAAFGYGIPYSHMFGHRGFSHSIVFAILTATLATFALRVQSRGATFAFLFLCAVSHPLLDALTSGGLGVALFSPFSNERYFFPWRPIQVSPINPDRFFGERGIAVLVSELKWVWLPSAIVALAGRLTRRSRV